jgi:hypothetical protein
MFSIHIEGTPQFLQNNSFALYLNFTLLHIINDNFPSYDVPIWLSIIHHYLCHCQI